MTCALESRPTRRMKIGFRTTERASSATATPMRRRPVTMDPACVSCCSCRVAFCVARIATTRTRGTSRMALTCLHSRCSSVSRGFASSIRALGGGLTISGGEPMVQLAFTKRIFAGAKKMGLHTAIETSGFLSDRADESYLSLIDLILLDIKSSNPDTYRKVTGRDLAPTLRFAERLASMGKPAWVRFTLVPGQTDDPANVEGIAKFVAPMKNVEWVEIQPFHQMGAFKWKALNLEYKCADTPTATPELVKRVIEQFRAAGCRVR